VSDGVRSAAQAFSSRPSGSNSAWVTWLFASVVFRVVPRPGSISRVSEWPSAFVSVTLKTWPDGGS
jgi:hypothetical protein